MYLQILTEEKEKLLFLQLAYLLAVSEKINDPSTIPVSSDTDCLEKKQFQFEAFYSDFQMKTEELIMLRKFGEELNYDWAPVQSSVTPSLGAEGTGKIYSVADEIKNTVENQHVSDRLEILSTVLKKIVLQAEIDTISIEKKKAMVFEALAMCFSDSDFALYEERLLVEFCKIINLNEAYLVDFKNIINEISIQYKKGLSIILE